MDWIKIITIVISIVSLVFTIFKTYRELSSKREMNDLEQLMKFMAHDKRADFQKQPMYIKDSFCQTVSFLKGYSFEEIEIILNHEEIKLLEIKYLLYLKKSGVIIYNEKDKKFHETTKSKISPKIRIFINYLCIFLAAIVAFFIIYQYGGTNITALTIACIIIGIVELPALERVDKIKSAQKFKKDGLDKYLKKHSLIIQDTQ